MPHLPVIPRPDVPPDHEQEFENHICPPTFGGGPLDAIGEVPDVFLERALMRDFDLPLPPEVAAIVNARNGTSLTTLPMQVIEDPNGATEADRLQFPSAPIRVREGQVVHAMVHAHRNTHTIHWHGIEPGPGNDGVGKHSWEVSGNFTYRFQPRSPGTFFYHCHKNTTLHFEWGMYGALIVDPPQGPGFYRSVGTALPPPFPNPTIDVNGNFAYQVEQIWAVDEMDSRWHIELKGDHNAFMQNCDGLMRPESFAQDGFLHDFRPDVFTIGAVVSVPSDDDPLVGNLITDPRAAIIASPGQVVLLRAICAGYIVQEFTFPLPARVVGMDGHALGVPPKDQYSFPFGLPAGQPFRLTSARRWDLVFQPTAANAGDHEISIKYRHAIDMRVLHEARVLFRVTGRIPVGALHMLLLDD